MGKCSEKRLRQEKEYRQRNRAKIIERQKARVVSNPEKYKLQKANSDSKPDVKERRLERQKLYYQANKKKLLENRVKYRELETVKEANRARARTPKYRKIANEYHKRRLSEDIQYKLSYRLRTRLAQAVRNGYKGGSAVRDLGCTIPELKEYLENLFQEGMTWDNWKFDGWHIDHIIPISHFDLTNPEELKKACHFTNLQPMWATDNFKKGNRV